MLAYDKQSGFDVTTGELMTRLESSNAFELFRCDHLDHAAGGLTSNRCESTPHAAGDSVLVGIGNSLVLEDTAALRLVKELARILPDDFCVINLEHSFSLLPEILESHRFVFIVDSMVCDGPPGTILILPLTDEVLAQKNVDQDINFRFSSTHSISWFDEIKLARLQERFQGEIIFIGIESSIAFERGDRLAALFSHAVDAAKDVLLSRERLMKSLSILPFEFLTPAHSK
jgi:hydrogenase maturation protease